MRIQWTAPALRDLAAIGEYIERDDPAAAARIVTKVFASVETLIAYPQSGRPGRIHGTRELVVVATPYIVPYRVLDGLIQILAVFHGARRWPEKLP